MPCRGITEQEELSLWKIITDHLPQMMLPMHHKIIKSLGVRLTDVRVFAKLRFAHHVYSTISPK